MTAWDVFCIETRCKSMDQRCTDSVYSFSPPTGIYSQKEKAAAPFGTAAGSSKKVD
jgi:hypothetical protein